MNCGMTTGSRGTGAISFAGDSCSASLRMAISLTGNNVVLGAEVIAPHDAPDISVPKRLIGQRDDMLLTGLHPLRGNYPQTLVEIDLDAFAPRGSPERLAVRIRQASRPPSPSRCLALVHIQLRPECRQLGIGQRRMVFHFGDLAGRRSICSMQPLHRAGLSHAVGQQCAPNREYLRSCRATSTWFRSCRAR